MILHMHCGGEVVFVRTQENLPENIDPQLRAVYHCLRCKKDITLEEIEWTKNP